MSQKLYLVVSGLVFVLVGTLHLLRLVHHWPVVVGPWNVPYALSLLGFPVSTAYAAWAAWLLFAPSRDARRPPE
jgi:hypothetical protein